MGSDTTPALNAESSTEGHDARLDVPGVLDEQLVLGSVEHARDEQLLRHLHVDFVLDAENARKRSNNPLALDAQTARGRVVLDDEDAFETFKDALTKATETIRRARADGRTVFVFCTHGTNESAVVCIIYLMLAERWTLERAYKHVQQKRPATAPRHAYIEKLRLLEREVHGRVTLRSAAVGPSMMDLMLGLRGVPRPEDADETASQVTEPESVGEWTVERASFMSNFSVMTGLHNGTSLRETMIIAERGEENESITPPVAPNGSLTGRGARTKSGKKDCIVMACAALSSLCKHALQGT